VLLAAESIVAIDRGYNDYMLFAHWAEKDRWQIELFFRALKQNLKVKTFVGTSENALYIQIWTAMKLTDYEVKRNKGISKFRYIVEQYSESVIFMEALKGPSLPQL